MSAHKISSPQDDGTAVEAEKRAYWPNPVMKSFSAAVLLNLNPTLLSLSKTDANRHLRFCGMDAGRHLPSDLAFVRENS
jgi:hypothetical protein